MNTSPALSVLIRTFNSARTLPALLARLDPGPDDEILVVDTASTDTTLAIAEAFPQTRVIRLEPPFHYSRALNAGFEVARHRWVISVSSHCIPLSGHFLDQWRQILAALPEDVAGAFGTKHFHESEAQPQSPVVLLDRNSPPHTIGFFAGSSNAAYRRDCWQAHPFDLTIPTGEDVEWGRWALANGWKTAGVPGVPVLYRHQGSFNYMFRKGWGEFMVFAHENKRPAVIGPFFLNVGSLTKKFLLGRIPFAAWKRQIAHALGVSTAAAFHRWRPRRESA